MPRAIRSSTIYLIAAISLFAGACAELRMDYQTPLFMENSDATRERVSTWVGPWVKFSVTDMRSSDQLKFSRSETDAQTYPQESVYIEEREFAYPLSEAIEMLLGIREGPSDIAARSADLCIRRYDYIRRVVEDSVIQYEVRAQYGFRAIQTEPCEGELEFYHASWSGGIFNGSSEERAKSAALSAFIDQVLREYYLRSRRDEPAEREIELVISPGENSNIPRRDAGNWAEGLSQLQYYQAFHTALGLMTRQLLVPDVNIASLSIGKPASPGERPQLIVVPLYAGIEGERASGLHLWLRLRWPNGLVIYDKVLAGSCESVIIANNCTMHVQLDTIARGLRKEIPFLLEYSQKQSPPAPAGAASRPVPAPENNETPVSAPTE